MCNTPQTQYLITRNVNTEEVQRTRQGNKIKQGMVGTSGRAEMGKVSEAFTFGAVSLHHKGRQTLLHSHYSLICACGLTFRENRRLFHITSTVGKHKSRILLRTKEKFMMQFHIPSWVPFHGQEEGRRILFQHHCERTLTDYSFRLFGQ